MEDHRRSTSPISVDFVQNAQPLPYGSCQQDDFDADDLHKPCVSTCCLCCNLGLGSILTGVGFVILNVIYIFRQMSSLQAALLESSLPEISFNDGNLDAIFAVVGIALAGVAALAAFVLMMFSCCCGVAEEVSKVKIGAFSWTVATGLCSIWVLGEAIYRTVPKEEEQSSRGYIIVTNINNVDDPSTMDVQELVITWLIAGFYLLFYGYLSIVTMSFVALLSRNRQMSQKEHLAAKQGIPPHKSDSPMTENDFLQRNISNMGLLRSPSGFSSQMQYPPMYGMSNPSYSPEPAMDNQGFMPPMLPPMFREQIISGPQGQPISVVIDPNGQIVPPEVVNQFVQQMAYQNQLMSESQSVVTDMTYRSGAALIQSEVMEAPVERTRSVRFNDIHQTRYIRDTDSPNRHEPSSSSCDDLSSTSVESKNKAENKVTFNNQQTDSSESPSSDSA